MGGMLFPRINGANGVAGLDVNGLINPHKSMHYHDRIAGNADRPPIKVIAAAAPSETWTNAADDATDGLMCGSNCKTVTVSDATAVVVTHELNTAVAIRGAVHCWFRIADPDAIERLDVRIYRDDDAINYYRAYVYLDGVRRRGMPTDSWWLTPLGVMQRSNAAMTDWGTGFSVSKVVFYVVPKAGETTTVKFGGVAAEDFPKAAFILAHDGNYSSYIDYVAPQLKARGLPGVVWSSVDYIGGDRSSAAELLDLHDNYGWEILSHMYNKTFSPSTTQAEVEAEVLKAKKTLHSMGFTRGGDIASWIGNLGYYDGSPADLNTVLSSIGYTAARSYTYRESVYGTAKVPADIVKHAWITNDLWNLTQDAWNANGNDAAALAIRLAKIQQVIDTRGFQPSYTHKVIDNPSANDVSPEFMQAILDAIFAAVDAGTAEVITYSEWLARTHRRQGYWRFDSGGKLVHQNDDGTWTAGY